MLNSNAPCFSLPAHDGTMFNLLDDLPLVLYFYPRDNTPGCSQEAQDFAAAYPQFRALGWQVVGISRDSVKSHQNFARKFNLPFPLLADVEEHVCQAYGVMVDKILYGKSVRGIERSTFVIDARGIVRASWHKVKVAHHVTTVLAQLATLTHLENSHGHAAT